jgi:hypothetical protein
MQKEEGTIEYYQSVLQNFLNDYKGDKKNIEIELRLGKKSKGGRGFNPNLILEEADCLFRRVVDKLFDEEHKTKDKVLNISNQNVFTKDILWSLPETRGKTPGSLRVVLFADGNSLYQYKKRLMNLDMPFPSKRGDEDWWVRLSISEERMLDQHKDKEFIEIIENNNPNTVRKKLRTTVFANPNWKLEVTKVRPLEIHVKRHEAPTVTEGFDYYEMEIEFNPISDEQTCSKISKCFYLILDNLWK